MRPPRSPLRTDVHRAILERILDAQYAPGAKMRDVAIAEELNVSRTPVREALMRLEAEGLVESSLNRGFSVKPLTRREVEEVYPLISSLESTALRTGGPIGHDALERLEALALAMRAARAPAVRVQLDTEWHQ